MGDCMAIQPIQREAYTSTSNKVESTEPNINLQKNKSEDTTLKSDELQFKKKEDLNSTEVEQSVQEMNQLFNTLNQKISFEIFDDKNDQSKEQLYVALIDKESEKIIKEIPPKEILEMRARIKEYVGMLVDKRI